MNYPNPGSWNDWLSSFTVNERRYIDTTPNDYMQDMRTINTPLSRRPESMKEMSFTCSLYTAVGAKKVGEVRYLICIERTK